MAETSTATPAPQGVEQPMSLEQRIMGVLSREESAPEAEPEPAPAPEAAPAEQEAQADEHPESGNSELTAEDLPDEPAPAPSNDDFEIVYKGQQRKLSRAEAIKLAEKGFDYEQKTEVLAQQRRASEEVMQRLSNLEQIIPQVMEEFAGAKAMESRMKEWDKVDWVALAQSNPTDYPVHRAKYDQEKLAYEQVKAGLAQKFDLVKAEKAKINSEVIKQEFPKLLDRIPEWRDTTKYKAEARQLADYLVSQGAAPERVDNLTDSLSVALAYKAMKYDALLKQKSEKVKMLQEKPPVPKPGARAPETSRIDKQKELASRLRKTGSLEDAAALVLSRLK